jgi:hypothetical protein
MRWSYVPVPEAHVAALIGAVAQDAVIPMDLPIGRRARWIVGGPMLAAGIGLAAWAVISAGEAEIDHEEVGAP